MIVVHARAPAAQIEKEFRLVAGELGLRFIFLHEGIDADAQKNAFQQRCELVVSTTGRLVNCLKDGSLNLSKVSYFVVDELDSVLEKKLLPTIEKAIPHLPRGCQRLLWATTYNDEVEKAAKSLCK